MARESVESALSNTNHSSFVDSVFTCCTVTVNWSNTQKLVNRDDCCCEGEASRMQLAVKEPRKIPTVTSLILIFVYTRTHGWQMYVCRCRFVTRSPYSLSSHEATSDKWQEASAQRPWLHRSKSLKVTDVSTNLRSLRRDMQEKYLVRTTYFCEGK